eukprot:6935488-Alexandrium_andersonii.AAC.1
MAMGLREAAHEIVIIVAYAPHAGYDLDARQQFFDELAELAEKLGGPRPLLVLGDLNTRIYHSFSDERDMFGPYP